MAVIHADLVGPHADGKNNRNHRGFQYILLVTDSATRCLWLLPIRHKTAKSVAATLFDEVISRVSVPSAILTDQGGAFMGEVVECLLQRLGIKHLRTSAYHPQTDAKCETVHFSVYNIITKLTNDKHQRWPDLLGTAGLAYNATVHTATGYSPHELFYSFAPSCPLDAMVSVPASDPVSNADEYALQAFERLQEATAFVRGFTGKNMQRMKHYYDSSVRPQSYTEGEKVLAFDPRQKRGKCAKWQVCWKGPVTVERKLNDTNYVLEKSAKSKSVVVHVDQMRKLPQQLDSESTDSHTYTEPQSTNTSRKRRRTATATDIATDIHCADSWSRIDKTARLSPLVKSPDTDADTHTDTDSKSPVRPCQFFHLSNSQNEG